MIYLALVFIYFFILGNPKPPHKGRIPQSKLKMPILPPVLNIETGLPVKNRTFSEPCIDPSNNGALERWVKNPSRPAVHTKLPGSQTERTYPFEPGSNRMVKLSAGKPIPPPKPKKWKQHAGKYYHYMYNYVFYSLYI